MFSSSLFAQAPNFTVTDVNGNVHRLYEDYLDQGKTVVIDIFFVNCPPCVFVAERLPELYTNWGAGDGDVEFFTMTTRNEDTDATVGNYAITHNALWPHISSEGGSLAALQPYTSGQFGNFVGAPTLLVIAPDGTVQFDAWSNTSWDDMIFNVLNSFIVNAGAVGLSSVDDLPNVTSFNIYPNPTVNEATIDIDLVSTSAVKIELFNALGQKMRTLFEDQVNSGGQKIQILNNDLSQGVNWLGVSIDGETEMTQIIKM